MISFPNAKINIGLNVVEKRPDGYHTIETIFFPTDLKDALEVIEMPNIEGNYEWINTGIVIDTPPEKNICIKAFELIKSKFPTLPKVRIHLHKAIPFGAGMGGGSADGAFILKMLNDLFILNLTNSELKLMAVKLGADCPFFIDNTPSYATGIGEILTPLKLILEGYHLGIVKPNIHVSTIDAFKNILPLKPIKNLQELINQPIEKWKNTIVNDFEKTVFRIHPQIEKIKSDLYSRGAIYASMSGSGSAVFGIFEKSTQIEFPNCFIWTQKL